MAIDATYPPGRVYRDQAGNLHTGTGQIVIDTGGTLQRAITLQQAGSRAKIGTTAGWVITGLNTDAIATVAASQTAATLSVAISGLNVGDTITGFTVWCSILAANACTLDAALRQTITASGATGTDSAITNGAITQIAVSVNTLGTATVTGLNTVVVAGTNYYILLTATTGAASSFELEQIEVNVTTAK